MNRKEPIAILGAGIGGLTLAAILEKKGYLVRVFEQSPKLGEVGAGLGLWANATRCLESIGIEDDFWASHGCEVHSAEVANPTGKILSRCDIRPLSQKLGAKSFVVHRADLHAGLAGKVSAEAIVTGARCVGLEQDEEGVDLQFADGPAFRASLAIGADGLRSGVRAALFGRSEPRYSGQICYRGIAEIDYPERHILREVQGRGRRCAVIPLDAERVYWWATECIAPNSKSTPEDRKKHLLRIFSGWKFGIDTAIEATPEEEILQNDLYDRPPMAHWSKGRVLLIGDAAHPTTPNLGQGACMAIEDAAALGYYISTYGKEGFTTVFSAFEKERMARCAGIVKESRRFGWIGSWSNPVAVKIREFLISSMPNSVMEKTLETQLGYRAPL